MWLGGVVLGNRWAGEVLWPGPRPRGRRSEPAADRGAGAWYVTREADALDWVCWRHYGRSAGPVEAVLAANPGLADLGTLLAEGLRLWLPELPAPVSAPLTLWAPGSAAADLPEPLAAPERYTTREADVLDEICRRHYGSSEGLATVLEANPGLADRGPLLPAGLTVVLPAGPATRTTPLTRLWD